MASDDWITYCDVCGVRLDQLAGEDFYDESRRRVTCAAHWTDNTGEIR